MTNQHARITTTYANFLFEVSFAQGGGDAKNCFA